MDHKIGLFFRIWILCKFLDSTSDSDWKPKNWIWRFPSSNPNGMSIPHAFLQSGDIRCTLCSQSQNHPISFAACSICVGIFLDCVNKTCCCYFDGAESMTSRCSSSRKRAPLFSALSMFLALVGWLVLILFRVWGFQGFWAFLVSNCSHCETRTFLSNFCAFQINFRLCWLIPMQPGASYLSTAFKIAAMLTERTISRKWLTIAR